MRALKSFTTAIKEKGHIPIPRQLRALSNLENGRPVSLIPVGDAIIVVPGVPALDEGRRRMRRMLKESGMTVKEMVAGIKRERESIFKEIYGRKDR